MKQPARRKAALRNNLEAYTFMAPYVIGVLAFFLFPLIFSLVISFGDYRTVHGGNTLEFVGLKNYIDLFVEDATYSGAFLTGIKKMCIRDRSRIMTASAGRWRARRSRPPSRCSPPCPTNGAK